MFWLTSETVAVVIFILLFGVLGWSPIFLYEVSLQTLKFEIYLPIYVFLFAVFFPCSFAHIIYLKRNENYSLNEWCHGHINLMH